MIFTLGLAIIKEILILLLRENTMGIEMPKLEKQDSAEEMLQSFSQEIQALKTEIESTDKPEPVEKLPSWRVLFPYTRNKQKRHFLIENVWNNSDGSKKVEIRVKKLWSDGKRYTLDKTWPKSYNSQWNAISISYKNQNDFNEALGKVLDKYIGTKRARVWPKAKKAYQLLETIEANKKSLKKKPIALWYYPEKFKEKEIFASLPHRSTPQWRIMRALRRKPITDAVEDRYGIPRWLLMALMAQETYGDPTIPNLSWDGGLGVIHIQWKAAKIYGNKTLQTFNDGRSDKKHGELIQKTIEKYDRDVKSLIKYGGDDRFHPIMAVDLAARYLIGEWARAPNNKDKRLKVIEIYNKVNRPKDKYVYPTLRYRTIINKINGDPMPTFGKEAEAIKKDKTTISRLKSTQSAIKNLDVTIDKKKTDYKWYKSYFKQACDAYGLGQYKALWTY